MSLFQSNCRPSSCKAEVAWVDLQFCQCNQYRLRRHCIECVLDVEADSYLELVPLSLISSVWMPHLLWGIFSRVVIQCNSELTIWIAIWLGETPLFMNMRNNLFLNWVELSQRKQVCILGGGRRQKCIIHDYLYFIVIVTLSIPKLFNFHLFLHS